MSKREETKKQIVKVATELFYRYGFEKTSMDDIAKMAQKAKGSLYYHFPSKEDLYKEVVEIELGKTKAKLEGIANDRSLLVSERLKRYLMTRMNLVHESFNYYKLLQVENYSANSKQLSFVRDIQEKFDNWEKKQFIAIIDGIEKTPLPLNINTDAFSDMLMLIVKGLETQFFVEGKYQHYIGTFNSIAELIISSLQNPESKFRI